MTRNQKRRTVRSQPYQQLEKVRASASRPGKPLYSPQKDRLLASAIQFVDPANAKPVLVPDKILKGRAVRKFQKIFDIKASDPGCLAGFTLVVHPELEVPIYWTGGAAVIPSAGVGPLDGNGTLSVTGPGVHTGHLQLKSPNAEAGLIQAMPITHGGTTYPGFYIKNTLVNVDAVKIKVSTVGDLAGNSVTATIYAAATGAAAWTNIISSVIAKGSSTLYNLGGLVYDHFAVHITPDGKNHNLTLEMSCTENAQLQASAAAVTDYGNGVIMQTLSEVQGGRVTGISALVTNTSPPLARGGNVWAARLPRKISPFSDPSKFPGELPATRYHAGAAELGAYSWWYPSDEEAKQFEERTSALDNLFDCDYLYTKLAGWSADSSVRVTVTYLVEFYIADALYEKIAPPLFTPKWMQYDAVLGLLPSSSCNPSHVQFRDMVRKAGEVGKQAYQHYKDHQGVYDLLLEAFAGLLL